MAITVRSLPSRVCEPQCYLCDCAHPPYGPPALWITRLASGASERERPRRVTAQGLLLGCRGSCPSCKATNRVLWQAAAPLPLAKRAPHPRLL